MAKLKGNPQSSNRTYTIIEPDVYEARVVRMVFIGAQEQRPYKGEQKPDAVVAKFSFELIGETVTMTDGDETQEVPAVVYWDVTVPGPGVTRGKLHEIIEATGIGKETFGDTQDYKGIIGMPLNVEVGSYVRKSDGVTVNCCDGVSKMNKKAKERLEDCSVDTLFFDCYQDDEDSKEAWTQLGNFVRDKIRKSSDCADGEIPAVAQSWADTNEEDADTEDGDEF